MLLTLLLHSGQLRGAGFSELENVILRGGLTADGEKADDITLLDGTELGVISADIALPVRIIGNIGGGKGDGIIVGQRMQGTG